MALLTCNGLSLGYDGKSVAQDVTFCVERGDYLCIVGENGSGKSTLMKTLLGLIPPLSGTITMGEGLKPGSIGYLPQQTPVQRDFPACVREVVLSGCLGRGRYSPFYTKAQKQRADNAMQKLEITHLKNRCYRELSGGQQQRVLLSRALCAADQMLLLDEPASGLDPQITEEMYALIEQLNKNGMTIIMISHDIAAALRYTTHILHVSQRPLYFGKTEGYLESPAGKLYTGREAL